MIETTFKHDGTLDKFLGDAVMAVFGAPIAHPDHATRAVRTAIAMQQGITALNEARSRDGKERINVGIGVAVGEVVAGTVGSGERMEYTVIGDSVNLASRLESNAKPGRILISGRTCEKVRDLVEVVPLGQIKVKGKEEQVEVYELVGHREAHEPRARRDPTGVGPRDRAGRGGAARRRLRDGGPRSVRRREPGVIAPRGPRRRGLPRGALPDAFRIRRLHRDLRAGGRHGGRRWPRGTWAKRARRG